MRNVKFLAFIICALLLFPLSASAGEASAPPSIVDNGGCLSDSDENSLTQKINDLKAQYPVDIVIVTEKRRKASTVQEEADDLFDKGGYGTGGDKSGILLLVDLDNYEWAVSTHGSAITILDSSYTRTMGDTLASSYLKYRLYYAGFTDYLSKIEKRLSQNTAGQNGPAPDSEGIQEATPEPNISGGYTPNSDTVSKPKAAEEKKPPSPSDYIITALVVGSILTVIYMARLKKQMKTANKQKNADVYRRNDQAIHIDKKDILLTSRVTRKPLHGNPTHTRNGERHGGSTGTF